MYYDENYYEYSESNVNDLKLNYKIINVPYFCPMIIKHEIFNHMDYKIDLTREKSIENMINFWSTHKDKHIFEKTDYLCNRTEKLCICNTQADDLRKIYDGENYKPNLTFVSFISEKKK